MREEQKQLKKLQERKEKQAEAIKEKKAEREKAFVAPAEPGMILGNWGGKGGGLLLFLPVVHTRHFSFV